MNTINKKITVLADNAALLTASGNYSMELEDGHTLTGSLRIELDSAFHRKEAHLFYGNLKYESRAYLFSKRIN